METLAQRIGLTPLIRARKLEAHLGVGEIYLKLEGNNPSGHREDRMAYLMTRDAVAKGFKTVCMGTTGTVGASLAALAPDFGLECVFYVPSKSGLSRKTALLGKHVRIVEVGKGYNECVKMSRAACETEGWFDANPGLSNNSLDIYAFSYISGEIVDYLGECPDTVVAQTSNGSSIAGLHLGFRHLWVREEIDRLPVIWAASSDKGNAIVESFRAGNRTLEILDSGSPRPGTLGANVSNRVCYSGQDALNAIYDSGGMALGVDDGDLKRCHDQFKSLEEVRLSLASAFPVAAFMKAAREGLVKGKKHVLVLDDGKLGIDIRRIEKKDLKGNIDSFIDVLDDWLIQFSDPREEIREAIDNALDKGFVLTARHGGEKVGIAVVSRPGFDLFFPKYHLAYIATKKTAKGMGIATQLIEKAIEMSDGDISLHVDVDNKRAIKLYEKMGFARKYYRMIYRKGH